MLKIEMSKLDVLFRRYKDLPASQVTMPIQINLPALVMAAQQTPTGIVDTQDLLQEISKVKFQL
jgi:hypothetical protein